MSEEQDSYSKEEVLHQVDALAERFDLVPPQHNSENKWYKIVLMDHVEVEHLTTFIAQLKATMHVEKGITA